MVSFNYYKIHKSPKMNYRVQVLMPLHYSEQNTIRMSKYIEEAKLENKYFSITLTPVFYMSPSVYNKRSEIGFSIFEHNNAANGVSMFFSPSFLKNSNLQNFDFLIYLEESCEPMSSKWALKLIEDLVKGEKVSGWHWVFRGKCREGAKPNIISTGFRRAIAYVNSDFSIRDIDFKYKVWDVPAFRYECVAFRVPDLIENIYVFDLDIFELGLRPNEIANLSERFFWEHKVLSHCPNIQFKLLFDSKKFPPFYPKNIRLFRELNSNLKSNSSYVPKKITLRRFSISHLVKSIEIFFVSLIKYLFFRKKLISQFKYRI